MKKALCIFLIYIGYIGFISAQSPYRDITFSQDGLLNFENGYSFSNARLNGYTTANSLVPRLTKVTNNSKFITCSNSGRDWGSISGSGSSSFNHIVIAVSRTNDEGIPDSSFHGDGSVLIPIPNSSGFYSSSVNLVEFFVQPNNKIIVIGNALVYGNFINYLGQNESGPFEKIFLFRLNENGTLDQSFGTNGVRWIMARPNSSVTTAGSIAANSASINEQGNIYIGSQETFSGDNFLDKIYKLNNNGTDDMTWNNVIVPGPYNLSLFHNDILSVVEHNGFVYFTTLINVPGQTGSRIHKCSTSGIMQNNFGSLGNGTILFQNVTYSRILKNNNQLFVIFSSGDSNNTLSIMNEDGGFNLNFGNSGIASLPEPIQKSNLYFSSDGAIFYTSNEINVYDFTWNESNQTFNTNGSNKIIGLTAAGQLNLDFGLNGILIINDSLKNYSIEELNISDNDVTAFGNYFYLSPTNAGTICQNSIVFGSQIFKYNQFGDYNSIFGNLKLKNIYNSVGSSIDDFSNYTNASGNENIIISFSTPSNMSQRILKLDSLGDQILSENVDLKHNGVETDLTCIINKSFSRIFLANNGYIFSLNASGQFQIYNSDFTEFSNFINTPIYSVLPVDFYNFIVKEFNDEYYILAYLNNSSGTNIVLFKLDSDLQYDQSFGNTGAGISNIVGSDYMGIRDFYITPSGIFIVGMREGASVTQDKIIMTKINLNGTIDLSFGDYGNQIIFSFAEIRIQSMAQVNNSWIYFFMETNPTSFGNNSNNSLKMFRVDFNGIIDISLGSSGFQEYTSFGRNYIVSPVYNNNDQNIYFVDNEFDLMNNSYYPCVDCYSRVRRMNLSFQIDPIFVIEELIADESIRVDYFDSRFGVIDAMNGYTWRSVLNPEIKFNKIRFNQNNTSIYAFGGINSSIYKFCINSQANCNGTVSISDNYNNVSNPLDVFPNPSTGIVNVNLNRKIEKSGDITIMNSVGMKVYEEKFISNSAILDLSHLSTGIYFIHLCFDNESLFQKFVIHR